MSSRIRYRRPSLGVAKSSFCRLALFLALVSVIIATVPAAAQTDSTVNCTLEPRLRVGGSARKVTNSESRVRSQPSTAAVIVGGLLAGEVVAVLDGPIFADGYNWWKIQRGGMIGWTAEGENCQYWLAPYADSSSTNIPATDSAARITLWGSVEGILSPSNVMDEYALRAWAGQRIVISLERKSGNLKSWITIRRASGNTQWKGADSSPGINPQIRDIRIPASGAYTIRAHRWSGIGKYSLSLRPAHTATPKATPLPTARPTSTPRPRGISYEQPLGDQLSQSDLSDEFSFGARAGMRIAITWTRINGDLKLRLTLRDPGGNAVQRDGFTIPAPNAELQVFRIPATGIYTIQALHSSGRGAYRLLLEREESTATPLPSATPAPPTITPLPTATPAPPTSLPITQWLSHVPIHTQAHAIETPIPGVPTSEPNPGVVNCILSLVCIGDSNMYAWVDNVFHLTIGATLTLAAAWILRRRKSRQGLGAVEKIDVDTVANEDLQETEEDPKQ